MKKTFRMLRNFIRKLQCLFASNDVLILGDSHAEVFYEPAFLPAFPKSCFRVVSVGGATASGLENPRSKTDAYNIFTSALNDEKYDRIVLLLGEVDTGFVIWYRARKYRTSVSEMLQRTVKTYSEFIDKCTGYAETIVISAPLPTIDDASVGAVAHARREIDASQRERTELTLEFNKRIETFCRSKNIIYINLDNVSLGEDSLVKKELKNSNPADHHYDKRRYAELLISNLRNYLQ